jgi:tetratricopeptide (TPR) repeat protein/predicted aspartyl protease
MSRSAGLLGGVTTAGAAARRQHAPWRSFALLLALATASATPVHAAGCHLGQLAELPVTMEGLRPIISAGINGKEVRLMADTGAFYSVLTPAAAAQLNLRLEHAQFGNSLQGVGGDTEMWLTRVKTFSLLNVTFSDVVFVAGGNDLGEGMAGVLGQNLFRLHDVEYDLANGMIRLFRPHDCKNVNFAYWTKATGQPVSQLDLYTDPRNPAIASVAYVNGARMRVLLDTGGGQSSLSLDAAKRAGITPESPGVVSSGSGYGISQHLVRTWVAPIASFKIGDEEVKNTRLYIFETLIEHVDMLLGADFFLSHRIFVANSEHKIFLTYNGGPVFRLPEGPADRAHEPQPLAADTAPGGAATGVPAGEPADAASLARRGSAFAARHDYAQAIADLNKACELAPSESAYFYQRALAHLGNNDGDAALRDFGQAIKLKPDDVEALLGRARLRLDRHDPAAATLADLDAADRAAPRESESRLALGDLYQRAGSYQAAVAQYSKWIEVHARGDVNVSKAQGARCWAGARWGQELDKALENCKAGLSDNPVAVHDGRGYVYLRRGEYEKAIADFDAALHLNPRRVSALYGRGIAKLRAGKSGGQADIAAATQMEPKIAEQAAATGIRP